jgi:hypothetical protein
LPRDRETETLEKVSAVLKQLRRWWSSPVPQRDIRQNRFADYDSYVEAQLKTNAAKRDRVWVLPAELELLASLIASHVPEPQFGLCHGVRNGAEVRALRQALGCEVWGTEISPSASEFESVIQWDFHEIKPEWIAATDFIYSNSLDHSYDPAKCLAGWLTCLSPQGRCFIHWSQEHDHTDFGKNGSDCFQATRKGYEELLNSVGVVEAVVESSAQDRRCIFVCRPK